MVLILPGSTEDSDAQVLYPDLMSALKKKNWEIMKMSVTV